VRGEFIYLDLFIREETHPARGREINISPGICAISRGGWKEGVSTRKCASNRGLISALLNEIAFCCARVFHRIKVRILVTTSFSLTLWLRTLPSFIGLKVF
jgi:hypothetical protein